MNVGRFRDKVEILRKTVTKDEFGAEKEVWTTVFTLYADIVYMNSKKYMNANELFTQRTIKVITYLRSVKLNDLVVFEGEKYRIIDVVPEVDLIFQTMICERINE